MSQCNKLVAQLQNIKELQIKLNQEIEVFSDARESGRQELTEILIRVYGFRQEILNTDLMEELKMGRLIDKIYIEYNEDDLETICSYLEDKTDENRPLNKKELKFLYQIDRKIEAEGLIRLRSVLPFRNNKKDLSVVFDCKPTQISIGRFEESEEKIIFHYGGFQDDFGQRNRIKYPLRIGGDLNIINRETMNHTIFPEKVDGSVFMNDTKRIENTTFPDIIEDSLYLNNLQFIENSTLPEKVGSVLVMNSIESAKGLTLPKFVGHDLDLERLRTAEGIIFPDEVGGDVNLPYLRSITGLNLPDVVNGKVYLAWLDKSDKAELIKRYPNLKIV